ncbi:class I SAM-dependent methyltransferase [Candidatus Pelagibacter sp.]|jgi:predicted O-methyltransferase YrrM|nr:class I SAM-dependent methyltransferase [Candidatus Pelagibacter sp.]
MPSYDYKLQNFLTTELKGLEKPTILEFGVKEGRSTKIFLEYCEKFNGKLYSVDVDDYSKLFTSKNWKFIKSRDDNFDYLTSLLPSKFDIIYLDSLHEANHVEKILYYYYEFLKRNGFFFIDDISWLPYLKYNQRDNFYCEINNKETFEKLIEIYNNNEENFDIFFTFISSGMCKILKKKDKLDKPKKMFSRINSIKNNLRKLKKFIKS